MVEVKLAGMNVPIDILYGIRQLNHDLRSGKKSDEEKLTLAKIALSQLEEQFTPEVLTATYARISRSPESIEELLKEALKNVPKARSSNKKIIYGMGHHSIADHVLFNFNITKASRLLIESIEDNRLAGYTEKSQRYVELAGEYVKPEEFSAKDMKRYEALAKLQNDFYFKTKDKIFNHLKGKHASELEKMTGKVRDEFLSELEGKAKEDARYVLCNGTIVQVGASYPGQTAEHTIRKNKYGRLKEQKSLAKQEFDQIMQFSPSIIQLTDPELFKAYNNGKELDDENYEKTRDGLRKLADKIFEEEKGKLQSVHYKKSAKIMRDGDVNLMRSKSIDGSIVSALLFTNTKEKAADAYALSYLLQKSNKTRDYIKKALKHISAHDKVPREFEMNGGLVFEIELSASAFAQLKRHRMASLLAQDYNPDLGSTIPEKIRDISADKELEDIISKSSELYREFLPKYGKAAEYCLTNAHRRRVLVYMNMRELYHFSRIREDKHAQWDIRNIAHSMSRLAKQTAPLTSILLGGKHEFESIKNKVYNPKP